MVFAGRMKIGTRGRRDRNGAAVSRPCFSTRCGLRAWSRRVWVCEASSPVRGRSAARALGGCRLSRGLGQIRIDVHFVISKPALPFRENLKAGDEHIICSHRRPTDGPIRNASHPSMLTLTVHRQPLSQNSKSEDAEGPARSAEAGDLASSLRGDSVASPGVSLLCYHGGVRSEDHAQGGALCGSSL